MLELVPAEAPGEGSLRPDDLAVDLKTGLLECVLEFPLPGRMNGKCMQTLRALRCAGRNRTNQLGMAETARGSCGRLGSSSAVALDLQALFGVALVIDVIWRVGDDPIDGRSGQQSIYNEGSSGIAAEQSMVAEDPSVTDRARQSCRRRLPRRKGPPGTRVTKGQKTAKGKTKAAAPRARAPRSWN